MRRNVSVEEISDGRLYRSDDLVKIGTNGCLGCSDCCRMDPVIVLDPWDVYMLQKGTGLGLEKLLNNTVKLDVIDGLIQPVLQMAGGVCPYLGADGRCQIHDFRPGICRLYPLGRSWEIVPGTFCAEDKSNSAREDFSYILQIHECTHCTGSKIKVKKWLGIPDLPHYEDYCRKWHGFLKAAQALCSQNESAADERQVSESKDARGMDGNSPSESGIRKIVCMQILEKCYMALFDTSQDFYPQFEQQLRSCAASCGLRLPEI